MSSIWCFKTVFCLLLTEQIERPLLQVITSKTDISDQFLIFTILEKFYKNPWEKTKLMKRDITEENINNLKFLLENIH